MSCLKITFQYQSNAELIFEIDASGQVNGYDYYEFVYFGTTYYIWHDASSPGEWSVSETLNSAPILSSLKNNDDPCPVAELPTWTPGFVDYIKTECTCIEGVTCDIEDRIFREYKSIKLPSICIDENRGLDDCCCEYLVLGNAGSDTWKNDKTSAWIKLSEVTDIHTFKLYKNNVLTTYTPISVPFANETNAFYTTINWYDVLVSDGVGCYDLVIEYEISGILGQLNWGSYNLLPYSIQNALNTARIRAEFDGYHEIEQIDFTGSAVQSTFRFYGYIGNRQPNTEIDNIIYSNREMKRVIRENLNTYEIITDPSFKCITAPLIDLYLLSENSLFISDYNAHNHDYCLKDVPVIVKESPEIEYFDFSRKAKVTCVVEDKFKNKRTYF